MSPWLIWCVFAGGLLGLGWPVQAVAIAAVLTVVSGMVGHLHFGIGGAVVSTIAGLIVLQFGFLIVVLSRAMVRGGFSRPRTTLARS
jgi:hypothetical protein